MNLAKNLLDNDIGYCGTTKCDKKNLPQMKEDISTSRGDIDYRMDSSGISCCKWMNKKPILIISSIHDSSQKLDVSKKQKDWSRKLFSCPLPVVDYNEHMGYVDLSDMPKGLYDVNRKSKKWWMRIFLHLLDVFIVNSFLIYKELSIEEIALFDFLCKTVYGLIGCRGLIKRKSTVTLKTSYPKKKTKLQ